MNPAQLILADGSHSTAERLAALPLDERDAALATIGTEEAAALMYDWRFWARPAQLAPPEPWTVWLLKSGRGYGKTRIGSEKVIEWTKQGIMRIAIVGRTTADVRDIIVYGESGILAHSPPDWMPVYEVSKRHLIWPNGATAQLYTSEQPDMLRGPQFEKAWGDEAAAWEYPQETYDNLSLCMRLGINPQIVLTTTPKNIPLIKRLMVDPEVRITHGTTYENLSNLAPTFRRKILARFEGTKRGAQELLGQLLEDVVGALWKRDTLERTRVMQGSVEFVRVVVAVDPPSRSKSDVEDRRRAGNEVEDEPAECGIVVVGLGANDHGYVLEDASLHGSPREWGAVAVEMFHKWKADRIVGEVNNGGDMVGYVIGTVDPRVPFSEVWASRGKLTRAEPVSVLYERGWMHHVGYFAELEDQQCTWVPGERSPDHMDALVWAVSELFFPQPTGDQEIVQADEDIVGERISPW